MQLTVDLGEGRLAEVLLPEAPLSAGESSVLTRELLMLALVVASFPPKLELHGAVRAALEAFLERHPDEDMRRELDEHVRHVGETR